jgi:TPR repeat protein
MYQTGIGVTQDYAEALRLFTLAAEAGDADAQFSLGLMYETGVGVEANPEEALKWYGLAAAQGDLDAADAIVQLAAGIDPLITQ